MSSKPIIIAIVDKHSGQITAYPADFPGLIVQGNSRDDVSDKLKTLMGVFIMRVKDLQNNIDVSSLTLQEC